jgi:hypothetical protein
VAAFFASAFPEGPAFSDTRVAMRLLGELDRANRGVTPRPAADRAAIELALATRYRAGLREARTYVPVPRIKALADDVLTRHSADIVESDGPTHPTVDALVKAANRPWRGPPSWVISTGIALQSLAFAMCFLAVTALVDALAFRGGVMRLLGLELVTADGRPASRPRVLTRTALTWAPVLLLALITAWAVAAGRSKDRSDDVQAQTSQSAEPVVTRSPLFELGLENWFSLARGGRMGLVIGLTACLLLVLLAGAILAIVNPSRGIQDRLAGTWIVPH